MAYNQFLLEHPDDSVGGWMLTPLPDGSSFWSASSTSWFARPGGSRQAELLRTHLADHLRTRGVLFFVLFGAAIMASLLTEYVTSRRTASRGGHPNHFGCRPHIAWDSRYPLSTHNTSREIGHILRDSTQVGP